MDPVGGVFLDSKTDLSAHALCLLLSESQRLERLKKGA